MTEDLFKIVTYKKIAQGTPGPWTKLAKLCERFNAAEKDPSITYRIEKAIEETETASETEKKR